MWKITVLLFVLPFVIGSPSDSNNVQRTRTSIKVAKNLDPDAMETLEIKTRTGDIATIVVKKRDGRQQFSGPPADQPNFQLVSSSNEDGPRIPDPVVIRSDSVYVKNQKDEDQKKSRSLLQVDTDGIPVITGVREPDDENDTQVWRNARVINGILVPNAVEKSPNQHAGPAKEESRKPVAAPMFNGVWQVYRKKPESATENVRPAAFGNGGGEQSPLHFTAQRDSYDEKYMTDKILGYIKNINGNILDNGNGRSVRMLEPKAEARVLHAPSVSVFPNSAAYSPKTAPRLTFEESARTPVLQYAHPELGVQAAKYEAPAQAVRYDAPVQTVRYEAGPAPATRYDYAAPVPNARYEQHPEDVQRDGRRQQALSYFGHDIHADRSPYAFEPGLEKESRVKVPKKYTSPQYGGYLPEKQGKYAPGFHVNGGEASFWTVMKNSVKSSFDKMTDLTRPMVDPLVEATQKITGNLGFSHGNRELTNVVKEKLGMVATPSVLLPALGLVAGGAALGLGAVAVGRLVTT